MAIANTGTEACAVAVTRLELRYKTADGEEKLLTSGINGVQHLADGTDGKYWGQVVGGQNANDEFIIPAGSHYYIHPFGPRVEVPTDATELTVTFSAKITDGCVTSAGIDTYSENRDPTAEYPYTQNGSTTDFIKEAMKTPWMSTTVDPQYPVSLSIQRSQDQCFDK